MSQNILPEQRQMDKGEDQFGECVAGLSRGMLVGQLKEVDLPEVMYQFEHP